MMWSFVLVYAVDLGHAILPIRIIIAMDRVFVPLKAIIGLTILPVVRMPDLAVFVMTQKAEHTIHH